MTTQHNPLLYPELWPACAAAAAALSVLILQPLKSFIPDGHNCQYSHWFTPACVCKCLLKQTHFTHHTPPAPASPLIVLPCRAVKRSSGVWVCDPRCYRRRRSGSTFNPEYHRSSGSNADRDPAVELLEGGSDSEGSDSEGRRQERSRREYTLRFFGVWFGFTILVWWSREVAVAVIFSLCVYRMTETLKGWRVVAEEGRPPLSSLSLSLFYSKSIICPRL